MTGRFIEDDHARLKICMMNPNERQAESSMASSEIEHLQCTCTKSCSFKQAAHMVNKDLSTIQASTSGSQPKQQVHKDPPIGKQCSTRVGGAKLIGSEEVVQELVVLALPPVPIEENADPGYHTLKKKNGQCPDEC